MINCHQTADNYFSCYHPDQIDPYICSDSATRRKIDYYCHSTKGNNSNQTNWKCSNRKPVDFNRAKYLIKVCDRRKLQHLNTILNDFEQYHHNLNHRWTDQQVIDQHYDWWAFPLDKKTDFSSKPHTLLEDHEVLILRNSPIFIKKLRQNAIRVANTFGVNLLTGNKQPSSNTWWIRYYKLLKSLYLFNQLDLYQNGLLHLDRVATYGSRGNLYQHLQEKVAQLQSSNLAS